jgi:hypothetical protein
MGEQLAPWSAYSAAVNAVRLECHSDCVSGDVKSKEFYRRDQLVVWLQYDESTMTFYGQDLGGYPNTSEYEYWLTVASEDLRQALGGTDGDQDFGDLACEHAEDIMAVGEMSWLREHGVKYKFHSWIGSAISQSTSS